jgi:hypothetical protein
MTAVGGGLNRQLAHETLTSDIGCLRPFRSLRRNAEGCHEIETLQRLGRLHRHKDHVMKIVLTQKALNEIREFSKFIFEVSATKS